MAACRPINHSRADQTPERACRPELRPTGRTAHREARSGDRPDSRSDRCKQGPEPVHRPQIEACRSRSPEERACRRLEWPSAEYRDRTALPRRAAGPDPNSTPDRRSRSAGKQNRAAAGPEPPQCSGQDFGPASGWAAERRRDLASTRCNRNHPAPACPSEARPVAGIRPEVPVEGRNETWAVFPSAWDHGGLSSHDPGSNRLQSQI